MQEGRLAPELGQQLIDLRDQLCFGLASLAVEIRIDKRPLELGQRCFDRQNIFFQRRILPKLKYSSPIFEPFVGIGRAPIPDTVT